MRIPVKTSYSYARLTALYKHGPMTFDDAIKVHGLHGDSPSHIKIWYDRQVDIGNLIVANGIYALSSPAKKYFDDCAEDAGQIKETVPPRTPNPFRPLSAKYIPSIHANRADADQRPEHNIYVGGTAPEPFRGVA